MTPPAGSTELAAVVAQLTRVADALTISNTQVASVIGEDADGETRVRTEPKAP